MAVYKYNALLKASIASATNAHRLGANEAPPAIISTFLGTQISDILDKFENSSIEDAIEVDDKGVASWLRADPRTAVGQYGS